MKFNIWPKPFRYIEHSRIFVLFLCLVGAALTGSIFLYLYERADNNLNERLHEQASAYADLIDQFRTWNSNYNGVYVEKKPWVISHDHMGEFKDIQGQNAKVYTLRNHAVMTAEVSRMCEKEWGRSFRIVSKRPLDNDNRPNSIELEAIDRFERGEREYGIIDQFWPRPAYRYLRPLYVEANCLECHYGLGYKVGDIIGALSVTIPVKTMLEELQYTRRMIAGSAAVMIAIFILVVYLLTWLMISRLDIAQRELKRQATMDELTGLKNRRNILDHLESEFQRAERLGGELCVMIADIDHFKRVNDTFGHQEGDRTLKEVAGCLRDSMRSYDSVGRIGGEEFMVVSPGVPVDDVLGLAERIRTRIAQSRASQEGEPGLSISIGLTMRQEGDTSPVQLMKRADQALYQAKEAGRNRVVLV
jgi:diguanylate cyclase (GGDEF)-like protein